MIDPLLELTLAASLALLFFFAARHKRAEGAHFEAQLAAYEVLPTALVPASARLVPLAEFAIALALLVPVTRTAGAIAAAALLLAYAGAMGVNLLRGRSDIDCGCGAMPQPISGWLVGRNVALASAALAVCLPVAARPFGLADALLCLLLTALLAATYAMFEQLTANHGVLRHWSRHLG